MRLIKIISLHFQQIFHHRLRSFVWFLIPLLNTLTLVLFWSGAIKNTSYSPNWNMTTITTYYFLLTIAGAMLSSHIEDDVAEVDIQLGELVRYLIRPFPYFWIKFIEEIPYRVLQGSYGILLLIFFVVFFKLPIGITNQPSVLLLTIIMAVFAFSISFLIKMNMGLSAFWITERHGFFELITIISIIFSGGIVPIYLLPSVVQHVSFSLPFAYIAYYPVVSLQGQLPISTMVNVLIMQVCWIIILACLNRILWTRGVSKFTALGQ